MTKLIYSDIETTPIDEKVYESGDWFYTDDYGYCVLAQVDTSRYALIDMDDGNRIVDPIEVKADPHSYNKPKFSLSDISKMLGSYDGPIKPVREVKMSVTF